LVLAAAALVLLGGGGVIAWSLTRATTNVTATERTTTVSTGTVKDTVGATGTVEPARRADLAFAASGTVTSVKVAVGDRVEKGDVLATLEDDSLQADLEAATADLESAQDDLDAAVDDPATTTAELNAAKAKVAVDQSAVSSADTALDSTTLRATFAGTVAEVDITKGDTVGSSGSGSSSVGGTGSSSASTSTSAAVTVISTDRYTVSASVQSADLAKVKKGLQAQITTTGSTSAVFGTVSSVAVMASSGSAGTGTGATSTGSSATFPVVIAVTGIRSDLYAGATANVSIIVSQRDGVLTVPTAAISTAGGQTVVTKLVGATRTVMPVSLGTSYGVTTEVTQGLVDGDQVVVPASGRTGGAASGRSSTGTGAAGLGGAGAGGGGFGPGAAPGTGGGTVGAGTGAGGGSR
jgi:multidrug efflux pump subunit AcrA (membrane-fusion protein)